MSTQKTNSLFLRKALGFRTLVVLIFLTLQNSCAPDQYDDPIPLTTFPDIHINLNLPEYISLKTNGGSKLIDGGVRGIILHRLSDTEYFAYEQNCSFHPNDACATVNVHSSTLYMIDSCCGSTFAFDTGLPTFGPAWRPLRKYQTTLDNSVLTITEEIIE